jgi:hypothetical protein
MRIFKSIAAVAVMAAGLSACSNNQVADNQQADSNGLDIYSTDTCYWEDGSAGAPAWSCNYLGPDENFLLFAVGKAHTSKFDASLSRNKALSDSQAELQRQIEAKVEKGFREGSLSAGAMGSRQETLDVASKQVLNNIVKGTLNNVRIIKQIPGPDDYTYVLAGVAKEGFDELVSNSVRSSLGNQHSQYQVRIADKIQSEFDKDFDKYTQHN